MKSPKIKTSRSPLKRILRGTGFLVAGILAFGFLIGVLVTVPFIQSWLVKQAEWVLEDQTGAEVRIGEVDVAIPSHAVLRDLALNDQDGNRILKMDALEVNVLNFSLWDYLFGRSKVHKLRVRDITLIQPDIHLFRRTSDGEMNFQFILDAFASEDTSSSEDKIAIFLDRITIEGGNLVWVDSASMQKKNPERPQIDFSNIHLNDLWLSLSMDLIPEELLKVGIEQLQVKESISGFNVRKMALEMQNEYTNEDNHGKLNISSLNLRTDKSDISLSAEIPEASLEEFIDNPEATYYQVVLRKGNYIDFADIEIFLEEALPLQGRLSAQGQAVGTLNRLKGKQMNLSFGSRSRINADVDILHLLDAERMFLDVQIAESFLAFDEVQRLLPVLGLPDFVDTVKQVSLNGEFRGNLDDFQIKAQISADTEVIQADMNLKLPPRVENMTFEGKALARNFNVDALGLTKDPISKRLNFEGQVSGKELPGNQFDILMDAKITDSDLAGYYVDSVYANVEMAKQKIQGLIYARDREGWADLDVDIDLSKSPDSYIVDGNIEDINLQTYDLYEEPVRISSTLDIDLNGDSIENLNGSVHLVKSQLSNSKKGESVQVPDLFFQVNADENLYKYLNLKSSLIDMDLAGTFTYEEVLTLIERIVDEGKLFFENNDSLITEYYASKEPDTNQVQVLFGLAVRDSLNPLLDFFDLPLAFAPRTSIYSELKYDGKNVDPDSYLSEQLNLEIQSDSIRYTDIQFKKIYSEFFLTKPAQKNIFRVDGFWKAALVDIDSAFGIVKPQISLDLVNKKLSTTVNFNQRESGGIAEFTSNTTFNPDGTVSTWIIPDSSSLLIHGDTLRISPGDSITFRGGTIDVYNLLLQNDDRYYRLNGLISDKPEDVFTFEIGKFDLKTIEEFYPVDFEINGLLGSTVTANGLLGDMKINVGARLQDFSFEGKEYGSIFMEVSYDDLKEKIDLEGFLQNGLDTFFTIAGNVNIADTLYPVNLGIQAEDGVPIDLVSPFVKGNLYALQGKIGFESFNITGTLQEPIVNGIGYFKDAGFGVNYFKTSYVLNGKLIFDNQKILFENIKIKDENNRNAELFGAIRHRGLQEFTFNMQLASAKNFLLMNTRSTDNELFYGKLLLNDALADISGDLNNMSVEAITSFAPGSAINLPISDDDEYGRPEYILFKGEERQGLTAETGLSGFDLRLTALASEDLQVNLIFDERVGDIIRARGNGDITMVVDDGGTFSIEGDYNISSGNYLFTLQNLINKKFTVRDGGNLSWDGDPFTGTVSLDAVYPTYADISTLSSESNSPHRVLTRVVMHLEGPILQPAISLAIELPNIDEASASDVISYLNSIKYDERELNNQVFSLIVFNRFAPPGSFVGEGNSATDLAVEAVATTLSEMINNQLNYWVSRATGDKVNVNVNAANVDDVNVLVSAKLFGDRVTIERDGNIVKDYSQENVSGIVGNLSIVIRLLPSQNEASSPKVRPPELVVEVFGREDLIDTDAYQTGIGIFYKKDMDRLRELFRRQKVKKEETEKN